MKKIVNSMLQRLSRILGFEVNYFIKSGSWTSIPIFAESAINLLVAMILTRVINQTDYGEFRFFLSLLGIMAFFSLPGMSSAMIQSVSKKYYKSYVDGTNLAMKSSLLGSLGFLFMAVFFYFTGKPHVILYFTVTALLFPFFFSTKTHSQFLLAREEFDKGAIYNTIQLILMNFIFILSIFIFKKIEIIIISYIVAGSLTNLLIYLLVKNKYKKDIKKSKKDPGLKRYGIHLSLMQIGPLISSNLDKILMAYFLDFRIVAIFAIGQTISQLSRFPLKPLMRILIPKFSRLDPRLTFNLLMEKIHYIIGISVFISIMGAVFSPFLIRTLFPPEYDAAIIYAQVLFFGYIFALGNSVFPNYLTSHKRTESLYKINIYPSALRIMFLLILLPLIGIWGAVLAQIIYNYSLFGFSVYYSAKTSKMKSS